MGGLVGAFGSFGIFLACLLVLLATRTPVGIALALVAMGGTAIFVSPSAISQLASSAFSLSSNFILVVVPLFILMGEVLSATGIGASLFRAAELWLRRLPGSLAIGTVWACAVFGSVCGSSPVTATTIGSIYSGAATPTEAGAVGAAGALLLAACMRRLTTAVLMQSLQKTIRTTAMFLLLLTGGLFSSYLLARLGIPQAMSDLLTSLPLPSWGIMVIINVTLLILGMFMDPGSIVVIVIPIFLKTVIALGYDPVWFGIIVTIQSEIAAITPPVGFNLFVLKSVVPGAQLSDVAKGSVVFVIPMLVAIVILTAFPEIALFVPQLLLSRQPIP
jgi:C4-dicarboxylate transporter DctM subunit